MVFDPRRPIFAAMLWLPVLAGLFPLKAMYLLLVIFAVILIAAGATFWTKRRFYNARLDDETVERLKNLKDDHITRPS
ncbi:MAG: hypothetical protein ACR2FY_25245 [Pirellulaceae bacterium]